VLVSTGAFLISAAAAALVPRSNAPPGRRMGGADLGAVARSITARPYVRGLSALVVSGAVVLVLVDFVFKSAAAQYVAAEELAGFFAATYLGIDVLTMIVQVGAVALLLRTLGAIGVVAVVPALLLVTSLGLAVGGGLSLALIMRAVGGSLQPSLLRTGVELLSAPVSRRLRVPVRGLVDAMASRAGQALAAVVILVTLSTTSSLSVFAALVCVMSAVWLSVAVGLRRAYLDELRSGLQEERGGSSGPSKLDAVAREALVAALNSPDDRRVAAALEMLHEQGEARAIPAPLLYHPSPPVAQRVIDIFGATGRDDALDILQRLAGHGDPAVRAASLRALSTLDPDRAVFEGALRDPDLLVSATARVALVACGWADDRELALQVLDMVIRGEPGVQRAVAMALRARPSALFEEVLVELLLAPDADVVEEAIRAAAELRTPGLVEPLIRLLARRDVRDRVRKALAGFGPLALARLAAALSSSQTPLDVRRHIPGAVAAVGSVRAPEILLRHLQHEPDGMTRFKVLDALGRWRREQPGFPLDVGLLQAALGYAVSTGARLMEWRERLSQSTKLDPSLDTELHEALTELLRDKQDRALERALRLLDLQSGGEELLRVYRGLRSPRPETRASSRELLRRGIISPLRRPLIALVDDLYGEEDAATGPAAAIQRTPAPEPSAVYAQTLSEIAGGGMESASSLAAAHAVELGLASVRPALEAARPLSADHRHTLVSAARQLAERGIP
jgi:hypothetical protein